MKPVQLNDSEMASWLVAVVTFVQALILGSHSIDR